MIGPFVPVQLSKERPALTPNRTQERSAMGTRSKFFRALVEGQTISDGRKIDADWIDQIVETHNTDTYTPRINLEHLSGYSPEPPFNGYGSVFAVKASTDDIVIAGKTEKRRALYCQVDGNDQLVELADKNQKPFPSVELTDSYAGCGKIGLIGLAFTDKPASIGTQALQFSRSMPGSIFAPSSDAVALEFEASPADPAKVDGAIAGFFSALAAKLKGPETPPVTPPVAPSPANDNVFDAAAFSIAMGNAVKSSITAAIAPVTEAQAAFDARFTALETQLASTPATDNYSRTPSTGGGNGVLTDC